jgi:hypothetical protein
VIDINEYICYSTNESQFNHIVETLEKYKKPISLQLRKNVLQDLPKIVDKITRVTNLTGLTIEAISLKKYSSEEWMKLTALKNLKFLEIDKMPTLDLITNFPNLEMSPDIRTADAKVDLTPLTKLAQLRIHTLQRGINMAPITNAILGFTNLTLLEIDDTKRNFSNQELSVIFNTIHGLKALSFETYSRASDEPVSLNGLTALENLEMISKPFCSLNSIRLTSLTAEDISANFQEFASSLVNLKRLYLGLNEGPEDFYSFMTALTALEKCSLSLPSSKDYKMLSYFRAEKLQFLDLSEDGGILYLPWLMSMTSLRTLRLEVETEEFSEIYQSMTNLTKLFLAVRCSKAEIDLSKLTRLRNCELEFEVAKSLILPSSLTQLEIDPSFYGLNGKHGVDLSNLPNLESLKITHAEHVVGMECLTKLTHLHCESKLPDPTFLRNLPNLAEVSLETRTGSVIPYLASATNLQKLRVSHVYEGDADLIANFGNLRHLQAENVPDIRSFYQVQSFKTRADLIHSPVTRLTKLEYLSWGDSSGFTELQTCLPKLWKPQTAEKDDLSK